MKTTACGLAFLMLMSMPCIFAQQKTRTDRAQESGDDWMNPPPTVGGPVLDMPLDPETYLVGPGDRFTISIGTSTPLLLTIAVSAEGRLVIPTVGSVDVASRPLAEVLSEIQTVVGAVYLRAPVAVVLSGVRNIRVRLEGDAVRPGVYEQPASSRVSSLVGQRNLWLRPFAKRSILIQRHDGRSIHVDLERYDLTKEGRYNPHLAEGDLVIVRAFDVSIPTVAIGGAVWIPGIVEFVSGDRLIDLVRIARGVRGDARPDSIIHARQGLSPIIRSLVADSAIELRPGDRVWIPGMSETIQAAVATIHGEVRSPGVYPITENVTRLSDLIGMAGGVTEEAMLSGANLFRAPTRYEDISFLAASATIGNSTIEDSIYVREEQNLRVYGERVSTDFRAALSQPGGEHDPYVRSGDRLEVPRRMGSVFVFGQVSQPGHRFYVPGQSVGHYIKAAGGYTEHARSGDVRVIKFASKQWLDPDATTIEEGDAIWVPKQLDRDLSYRLTPFAQIVGILGSIATIILVITQVGK